MKENFTEDEKLSILNECKNANSVKQVAEKYQLKLNTLKMWAQDQNFQLDFDINVRRQYR